LMPCLVCFMVLRRVLPTVRFGTQELKILSSSETI